MCTALRGIGLHQHHRELVAAVAEGGVHRAELLAEQRPHLAQHRAAHQVSVGVVDVLEVVQVEEEERDRVAEAPGAGDLGVELLRRSARTLPRPVWSSTRVSSCTRWKSRAFWMAMAAKSAMAITEARSSSPKRGSPSPFTSSMTPSTRPRKTSGTASTDPVLEGR